MTEFLSFWQYQKLSKLQLNSGYRFADLSWVAYLAFVIGRSTTIIFLECGVNIHAFMQYSYY